MYNSHQPRGNRIERNKNMLLNAARPTRELKAEQIHISSIQSVLKDKLMRLGEKGDLYAGFDRSRNILKRTFIERWGMIIFVEYNEITRGWNCFLSWRAQYSSIQMYCCVCRLSALESYTMSSRKRLPHEYLNTERIVILCGVPMPKCGPISSLGENMNPLVIVLIDWRIGVIHKGYWLEAEITSEATQKLFSLRCRVLSRESILVLENINTSEPTPSLKL